MAVTYSQIATQTLGSSASTVTFSSISGTYTDLVLISSAQGTVSGNALTMQFNSDTGTNYSTTILRGNGTTASSTRQTSVTNMIINNLAELPTASFGAYITNFMNYSNSTTYKTVLSRANNASTGVDAIVGLWRSTSAITSIVIGITGGNIASGSTFSLYGIKAA